MVHSDRADSVSRWITFQAIEFIVALQHLNRTLALWQTTPNVFSESFLIRLHGVKFCMHSVCYYFCFDFTWKKKSNRIRVACWLFAIKSRHGLENEALRCLSYTSKVINWVSTKPSVLRHFNLINFSKALNAS